MERYTIKDVSERFSIPASTIRYYEKEGLLPYTERSDSGYRVFNENDIMTLRVVECLKKTGMSIKGIRHYFELVKMGEDTLEDRYELFLERRREVISQIEELQKTLEFVDYKCRYYEHEIAASSEMRKLNKCPDGIPDEEKLPCEK